MLADGAHRYNAIHSGKNLNIFSGALHAFSMADEEWRVADLLDEEQPIVADAKLAKQIVEVLGALDETNLDVRVPKAAREFAENTLSEWFEIIAEIEKKRGNIPYLINRELYQPGTDGARIGIKGLGWRIGSIGYQTRTLWKPSTNIFTSQNSTNLPRMKHHCRDITIVFSQLNSFCGYWLLTPHQHSRDLE